MFVAHLPTLINQLDQLPSTPRVKTARFTVDVAKSLCACIGPEILRLFRDRIQEAARGPRTR